MEFLKILDVGFMLEWLLQEEDWATCPLTESGFLRVSMMSAYRASFEDARQSVSTLCALKGHRFLADDVNASLFPRVASYKETTDAHLVTLARRNGRKLANLDRLLLAQPWVVGIAENPLGVAI